jgi:hypothetical protein
MPVNSHIKDGTGSNRSVKVFPDNSLFVSSAALPPVGTGGAGAIIFRQYMTDDGTSTGSSDMKVNGQSSETSFFIPAHPERDRYITTLSFEIADGSATLNKFGNLTALTNGCELRYEHDTLGFITIHEALKSNWDFVRLCLGSPPLGGATDAFKANNVSGASEGYIPVLDLSRFLPPYGIKLDAGTSQKIELIVKDDVTGVDLFDVIAYGFDRLT